MIGYFREFNQVMKSKLDQAFRVRDLFFEAAVDPTRWQDALNMLASVFDGWGATLVVMDKLAAQPRAVWLSGKWDPDGMEMYAKYYGRIDPAWPIVGAQTPLGQIGSCTNFISDEFVRRNEFYNDFLIPQGGRYLTGGRLSNDREIVGMSVHTGRAHGPLSEEEIGCFSALWPSLMSAMHVSRKLAGASLEAHQNRMWGMLEAFERVGYGAILLDRLGQISEANRIATSHFNNSLRIVNHRVTARDRVSDANLQKLIHAEITQSAEARSQAAVRITRPNNRSIAAFVLPILNTAPSGIADPSVLVLLVDPNDNRSVSLRTMIGLYGLTPSEARVAAIIGAGKSIEEVAIGLQIGVATARTHLKRIFQKIGIRRQAELVALVSRLLIVGDDEQERH